MTVIEGEVIETRRRRERNALRTLDVLPPDVETKVNALRPLDGAAQAAQVTAMLSHARTGLLAAIAAHDLPQIVEFKQKAAAIQEIAKQVRMGKEFQLDAAEFVRRAERGLGVAIREGQERGVVETNATAARRRELEKQDVTTEHLGLKLPTARDLAGQSELYGPDGKSGIYAMTDGVSDAAFEEALAEAKSEENLSRANVARKAKAKVSQNPSARAEPDSVPAAPKKTAHARRTIEMLSVTASNLALSVAELDPTEVDHEALKSEIDIIFESLGTIRSFLRKVNQQ